MNCPKCHALMESVTTDAGTVDRCVACRGLWFDRMEAQAQAPFASQLDIGSEATGREFNKVDRISCPVCANTPLTRMVDNDQPHIWFEACPSCNGRFFDAGEFKDLSERSLSDFLKRFSFKDRGA
jgi:Zn-finger nucleic acid-binding protein